MGKYKIEPVPRVPRAYQGSLKVSLPLGPHQPSGFPILGLDVCSSRPWMCFVQVRGPPPPSTLWPRPGFFSPGVYEGCLSLPSPLHKVLMSSFPEPITKLRSGMPASSLREGKSSPNELRAPPVSHLWHRAWGRLGCSAPESPPRPGLVKPQGFLGQMTHQYGVTVGFGGMAGTLELISFWTLKDWEMGALSFTIPSPLLPPYRD